MLLVIHNLPTRVEYNEIKDLIVSKCGLDDAILDNLQHEGSGTRVTVGVVDEEDAAILVRKMNGIYYKGQQVYVEDKRQKKDSDQPYRTSTSQQTQYMMGYDYNSSVQAAMPGMFAMPANYAVYPPQAVSQTVEDAFKPFGVQQPQPLMCSDLGAFNDFNQQLFAPLAQQNVRSPNLSAHQSPTRERRAPGTGRLEEARGARGERQRRLAPADQSPGQSNYRDFNTQRNERSGHSRGFDQDVYEKHGSRQNDDKRGYNAHDSLSGHFSNQRNMRSGHSSKQRDMRDGHSSNQGDMPNSHSSNRRDMRGGHSSNRRDMRDDHFSNQRDMRDGHSSMQRDMRDSHSSNRRDMRDHHSSNERDMHGGPSTNRRDMRDHPSSNERDMHGGPSTNRRDMRDHHSSNERDMRGGPSTNRRDMRDHHSSNERDIRGGHSSNERDMRGSHSTSMRGDHTTNMRNGYTTNIRGSNVSNMRDGHAPHSRDNAKDTRNDKPQFAKKRRWDDQSEQPELQARRDAHEPRIKKFAPDAGPRQPFFSNKQYALYKIKGVNKLMYHISTNLKLKTNLVPNVKKAVLRKVLNQRVQDIMAGELLSPVEIYFNYRARYPESNDIVVYKDVLKQVAELKDPNATKDGRQEQVKKLKHLLKTRQPDQLNANFQKAVEEEVDLIGAILEEAFKTPETTTEKIIYKRVVKQDICIELCKKLICSRVSKRITNCSLKIAFVYGKPCLPSQKDLENFLVPYDCLLVKKTSSPFYTTFFDSYDTIDKLCKMEPVPIGDQNILITFKHLLLAPKKEKMDRMRLRFLRRLHLDSLIEDSNVYLLDKNWQAVEEEERETKADETKKIELEDFPTIPIGENSEDEEMFVQQDDADNAADTIDLTGDNNFWNLDSKMFVELKESDSDDADNLKNNSKIEWDKDREYNTENYNNKSYMDENEGENKIKNENVDEDDDENECQSDDNEGYDENKAQNMGNFNIEDINLDDLNEDDLEDYY